MEGQEGHEGQEGQEGQEGHVHKLEFLQNGNFSGKNNMLRIA